MKRVILTITALVTIAASSGCCRMQKCLCNFYRGGRCSYCVDCENPSWGYSPECRGPMCGAPDCFKEP